MDSTKIFPVNVTIYNNNPKEFLTGLIYSEEDLEKTREICKNKELWLAIAYSQEENDGSQDNIQTTTETEGISVEHVSTCSNNEPVESTTNPT